MSGRQIQVVFRCECAKVFGVRRDTDASEVESVCVPAGLNRDITLGQSVAVCGASLGEQEHFLFSGLEKTSLQPTGQQGTPLAMAVIEVLVDAATVMEKRKQLDHMGVGACGLCQHQAIDTHPRPVGYAVVAMPVDLQVGAQMGDQSPAVNMAHRLSSPVTDRDLAFLLVFGLESDASKAAISAAFAKGLGLFNHFKVTDCNSEIRGSC